MTDRLGCRVLDKDGDDETPRGYFTDGMPEYRAIARAVYLIDRLPEWGPYRVTDDCGVTLHTILAARVGGQP